MFADQDWRKIARILIHPQYSSAENLNTKYDVAMIQLRRRITPGIIRPICLPDPGEIIRSHINDKVWFNSRSFTMHSTKIISHDTCVEHREYALQEYPYSITLKRFASIISQ